MTITIIITEIFVMTLLNLLLNIKECYYTNIPIPKIKTKELDIFLFFKMHAIVKAQFVMLYPSVKVDTYMIVDFLNSIFSLFNLPGILLPI